MAFFLCVHEDEDVFNERNRVSMLKPEEIDGEAVVLKDLTKVKG